MKTRILTVALASAFAMIPLSSAHAADASGSFEVKLVIEGACTIAASPLDFGRNSGSINGNLHADSALTVECTNGAPYIVKLNLGTGTGASIANRKMTNGTDSSTVDYNLYSDAARTSVWDDTVTPVSGTGDGSPQNIPVYGRVPTGQTAVSVGTYLDTIVATIEF